MVVLSQANPRHQFPLVERLFAAGRGRMHRRSSSCVSAHRHNVTLSMQRNIHIYGRYRVRNLFQQTLLTGSCVTERKCSCTHTVTIHTQSRLSRGIDVGGHYHIARTSIVVIHRRICIGFTFGQESRSPHFVLRRRMASSSCSFLGSGRNQGLVEVGPRFL